MAGSDERRLRAAPLRPLPDYVAPVIDEIPPYPPDAPPPRYHTTLLSRTGEMRVRAINRRRTMLFLVPPLVAYLLLVSLLPRLEGLSAGGSSLMSFPLALFFGLTSIAYISAARRPYRDYGVQLYGMREAAVAGLLTAVPACLLALLAKILWIRADPARAGHAILEAGTVAARFTPLQYLGFTSGYLLFTVVQEFVARGVTQTALGEILPRWHRPLVAALLANLLFAGTHLHISPRFAAIAFVPGLLWGWLFWRYRNLAAPVVNHALLGLFAYFVLDAELLR